MKLLREYFNKAYRNAIVKRMEKKGEEIFKKDGYRKDDKVDAVFLFDMLSKGYIDESYSLYIAETYEGYLTANGLQFLNAVNSGQNVGFNYSLDQVDCEQLYNRITSWDSLGILNNNFVKYIVEDEKRRDDYFPIILDQIYENDKQTDSEKFFDQFWNFSNFNENDQIKIFEQICKKISPLTSPKYLNVFFDNDNVIRFRDFFYFYSKNESVSKDYLKKFFDNNKDFYSDFIIHYKDQLDSINNALKQMEIQVDLTSKIVEKLSIDVLVKLTEFPVTKENYDILLLKENKSTESMEYMTRCVELDVNKSGFDDLRISLFCKNILFEFDKIEESVSTEEKIFSVSEKQLSNKEKESIFKKTPCTWKDIFPFYRGVGLNETLFNAITNNIYNKKNIQNEDHFLNDYVLFGKNLEGLTYKKYFEILLCDILESPLVSKWDNNIINNFFEIWNKYGSVSAPLKKMKNLSNINHFVIPNIMKYVFSKEYKYLDEDFVMELYKSDEKTFLNFCHNTRLSKFRLFVLKMKNEEQLRNAQRIIFDTTSSLPEDNDFEFKIYKDAALSFRLRESFNESNHYHICADYSNYLGELVSLVHRIADNNIEGSYSFVLKELQHVSERIMRNSKSFIEDMHDNQDIWLMLLIKSTNATLKKGGFLSLVSRQELRLKIEWLKKLRDEFEEYRRY